MRPADKKRTSIVHLITELNIGGAERMLHRLVVRMDRRRFRIKVISMTDTGPVGDMIKSEGIDVFALGMDLGRPTLAGIAKIIALLKKESVDIVQTWLYHADLLGLIAGKICGVKKIVWGLRCSNMHLSNYRFLTRLSVKIGGLLSPFADAIVVNSEEGKRFHEGVGYTNRKMVHIPNGFDIDHFCPDERAREHLLMKLGLPEDVVLIGLVARFDPMKDHINFLKAANLLAAEEKRAHFVMVGKGIDHNNEQIRPCLNDFRLKKRVHLLGMRLDIRKIIAALDIGTSSSAYGEGFSNTVCEIMLCGIPCVVTDVGDAASILGDTGLVVPPKNPKALAHAWKKLIHMGSAERKEMGGRARVRIAANYDIQRVASRFENLYQGLLSSS